jgi:hypothetical protein
MTSRNGDGILMRNIEWAQYACRLSFYVVQKEPAFGNHRHAGQAKTQILHGDVIINFRRQNTYGHFDQFDGYPFTRTSMPV